MNKQTEQGSVFAVCSSPEHTFSKEILSSIKLLKGIGVQGDTHSGKTIQHRSRVAVEPTQPNLRQVHLIARELFDELKNKGFDIKEGDLGENITTQGIDLLNLPKGTILIIGEENVEIEITGLRNPCKQIDDFKKGLLSQVLYNNKDGKLVRKVGIMAIVKTTGSIKPSDSIRIRYPSKQYIPLECV